MILRENKSIKFKEILNILNNNGWNIPDHQRESLWPKAFSKSWSEAIKEHKILTCFVTIGFITGNPDFKFINDGAQRTFHNLPTIIDDFKKNDQKNKETFTDQILEHEIYYALYEYNSMQEAQDHFIQLNINTSKITVLELVRPHIDWSQLNTPDKKSVYKEQISEIIDNAIVQILNFNPKLAIDKRMRLSKSDTFKLRKDKHVMERNDIALFSMFINTKKECKTYPKVTSTYFIQEEKEIIMESENDAVKYIAESSYDDIHNALDKMENLLINTANDIRLAIDKRVELFKEKQKILKNNPNSLYDILNDLDVIANTHSKSEKLIKHIGNGMDVSAIRYWFEFVIKYGYHGELNDPALKKLLKLYVTKVGCQKRFSYKDKNNEIKDFNVRLGQPEQFYKFVQELYPYLLSKQEKRDDYPKNRKGFHARHDDNEPFSKCGEGFTSPGPSNTNQFCGVKSAEEIEKLYQFGFKQ